MHRADRSASNRADLLHHLQNVSLNPTVQKNIHFKIVKVLVKNMRNMLATELHLLVAICGCLHVS